MRGRSLETRRGSRSLPRLSCSPGPRSRLPPSPHASAKSLSASFSRCHAVAGFRWPATSGCGEKKPPCRHSHVKKPKVRGRLRRDIPPSEPPCFIERPELYDAPVSRPLSWRQSCPLRRPAAHVAGSFGIRICAPGVAVPAGMFGPLEKFRPGHNHQSRAYQGSDRACFLWVRLRRTHASMQSLARGQVHEK